MDCVFANYSLLIYQIPVNRLQDAKIAVFFCQKNYNVINGLNIYIEIIEKKIKKDLRHSKYLIE